METPAGAPPAATGAQAVAEQWRAFGLTERRNALDTQASEIADTQDVSAQFRKKLAEDTRVFRKSPDPDKLKNLPTLLKGYQEEIDRLTKRSKFAESCFLGLYKSLAEIPDPVPALSSLMEETQKSSRMVEMEADNRRLQKKLSEFQSEFKDIKNQEVTIRRLEDRCKELEGKAEEIVQQRLAALERGLREAHAKELTATSEREESLKLKVQQSQEEIQRAVRNAELAHQQYFEMKTKYDEEQVTKQLEMDLLQNEIERANSRILSLERERDKLRDGRPVSPPPMPPGSPAPDLEIQLARKDIELGRLQETNLKLEEQTRQTVESSRKELGVLREKLSAETQRAEQLARELTALPSLAEVDAMKRRLHVLQALDTSAEQSGSSSEDSVERLFREKLRAKETETTRLKVSLADLEKEVQDLKTRLQKAEETAAERQKLIQRLEEDLAGRIGTQPPDHAAHANPADNTLRTSADDGSVLQVVCSQRDRFKARNQELEAELGKLRDALERDKNDIASVRADNVKLYEKIKYLESYGDANRKRPAPDTDVDLEAKYRPLYEDAVNPFTLFSRAEKDKRYAQLNAADKLTLSTSRILLQHKWGRTFLFVYAIVLHVLVFFAMYRLASGTSTCIQEAPAVSARV